MNKWYITDGLGKGLVLENEHTVDKERQVIYHEFMAGGIVEAWEKMKEWEGWKDEQSD